MIQPRQSKAYGVSVAGLMVTIGLILPFATAHAFGMPGTILLPMHIPILLCGLLCGEKYGAACGLVTPILSSILTGMPPVFPMLPIMIVQLTALGFFGGLMYKRFKLPLYPSLIIAMSAGWVLYGLMFSTLVFAAGTGIRALTVSAALTTGIPGLIIQLTIVPALIGSIGHLHKNKTHAQNMQEDIIEQARQIIKSGKASCVVIQDGTIVYRADGRGVSPLLNLYRNNPEKLQNAYVVDKIIGKAAAAILILGGAKSAYGEVMSAAALQYLRSKGIKIGFGRCVDVITSRSGTGICPIERAILDIDDPEEAVVAIIERLKSLQQSAG